MTAPSLSRILYVDDEEMLRTVASLALTRIGKITVELCDNGAAAVAAAMRFRPDLILLDVMMPETDGPTTLRALQANPETCRIPVIFLTAKAQPRDVEVLRALGAVDVIAKPFDPKGLVQSLLSVWNRLHAD